MAQKRIKRKRYVIAVKFQLKYVLYILAVLYIGAAIAGYTVYYTTWVILGEKLANVYPRGRLVYIFHAANMVLLIRLLLITPIFIIIGVIFSHRIAGPVYRIGKYIDSLVQGNYSQGLTLRKKDELKDLAAKMTQLCYKLRGDKEKRDKLLDGLVRSLEERNVSPDVLQEVKAKLEELKT